MTRDDGVEPNAEQASDEELFEEEMEPEEYDTMMQLERLESLEEEMMELGITSLEDVRMRIEELHQEIAQEDEKR